MAKKHAKRSTSKKSVNKSTKKGIQHILLPFSFRRIIVISTCIALFVGIGILVNNHGRQAVAGINITNGLFSQATISLPQVDNAVSYNLYYKKSDEKEYKNTVRDIPLSVTSYTVSYLTKGAKYIYKIGAVNASGAEFWWSGENEITEMSSM